MKNKKYTIVIPCYNCEKTIIRAVESLVNQTYKNIEIILVNDGSKDNTKTIIEDYLANHKEANIIFQSIENSGPSRARNIGLNLATGDYISFLDSDDYYDTHLFEELNEMDDIDIIHFGWIESNESDGKVTSVYSKEYKYIDGVINGLEALKMKFYEDIWLNNCNETYKISLLRDNGIRYIEGVKSGEDTNFIYKALGNAKTVASLKKDYFYNKNRDDSLLHSSFNENFLTLFKGTGDLYEYSKEHFPSEITQLLFSLYYYTRIILAKKIACSMKWYNFAKYVKTCKKYIPKLKKEYKLVYGKQKTFEVKIYNFSKIAFLIIYKLLK